LGKVRFCANAILFVLFRESFLFTLFIHSRHYSFRREPLVINPRGHISDDDHDAIVSQFEKTRCQKRDEGPPMYFIAPYDRQGSDENNTGTQTPNPSSKESIWAPSVISPEWVVVTRATALAIRSYDFLKKCAKGFDEDGWSAAFHETTASFKSYSVLLRIDSDFVFDTDSSSTGGDLGVSPNKEGKLESAYTRSMRARLVGPKSLRRKVYRNLQGSGDEAILLNWQPIESMVDALRERFGSLALFFYNALSPEVVTLLWRPNIFDSMSFSVMSSDYVQPMDSGDWKSDSLVVRNAGDILREISQYYQNIVTTLKIFDGQTTVAARKRRKVEQDEPEKVSDGSDNNE
jgi:hypothetical protein